MDDKRYAVLIDSDNISSKYISDAYISWFFLPFLYFIQDIFCEESRLTLESCREPSSKTFLRNHNLV